MKKIEIDRYYNYLDYIKFTYSDALNYISKIDYIYNDSKLNNVEQDNVPFFVFSFYKCIIIDNIVPNQEQLWDKYFNVTNKDFFNETRKYIEGSMYLEALKGRFCRSYPSLLREFTFALRVKEVLSDYKVIYNDRLDVFKGIDLFLIKNDKYYGIKLYLDTKNSLNNATLKVNRHKLFDNVSYIDLIFKSEFNNTKKIYLYTDEYIDELINKIKNLETK